MSTHLVNVVLFLLSAPVLMSAVCSCAQHLTLYSYLTVRLSCSYVTLEYLGVKVVQEVSIIIRYRNSKRFDLHTFTDRTQRRPRKSNENTLECFWTDFLFCVHMFLSSSVIPVPLVLCLYVRVRFFFNLIFFLIQRKD